MYGAFFSELEKIAAPHLLEYDYNPVEHGPSPFAKHMTQQQFQQNANHPLILAATEKRQVPAGKSSIVLMPSKESMGRHFDSTTTKDLWHNLLRHENTHYLRNKAGKMEGLGKPGLRNVLRSAREEGIAYAEGAGSKHLSDIAKTRATYGIGSGVASSLAQAYAPLGGPRKAALGGRLGAGLRALRLIK
jgi:hypothetical protein